MLKSSKMEYVVGNEEILEQLKSIKALPVFSPRVLEFVNVLSQRLIREPRAKEYPDVVAFGFWCRAANLRQLRLPYDALSSSLGRGVVFHIAPSNVAVNFAYSFAASFLAGNASIVRLPSKYFPQVEIICEAIKETLREFMEFTPYMLFVRYGHEDEINRCFSELCMTRVIWGGDTTISEIRKFSLSPRANEITFANRYSVCIIDGDKYLVADNKQRIARDFFNDTYLTDQNACTAPKIILWLGDNAKEARKRFWHELHEILERKYEIKPVQVVDKLVSLYLLGANSEMGVKYIHDEDNLIVRMQVDKLDAALVDRQFNSGFFIEYMGEDLRDILPVCGGRCQTISCFGVGEQRLRDIICQGGVQGVDRIVPMGHTLDFSLVWDGVDLIRVMSRIIA